MRHGRTSDPRPADGRLFAREWDSARAAWAVGDPALYRIAPEVPVDRPIDEMPSHFAALTRAIVHQQVSIAAGRAIAARFRGACGGEWTAQAVLGLTDHALREAGLSTAKARYVRALAEAQLRGALLGLEVMPEEDVIPCLTQLPGVGVWTAKMFLLFHLHRPDVFAGEDLGLRLGIRLLDRADAPPSPGQAEARAAAWQPYRSLASLVLWDLLRRRRAGEA